MASRRPSSRRSPAPLRARAAGLAFGVAALTLLGASTAAGARSTPSHGWDHHCGSQNQPGAGWYHVKAYNTSCTVARRRVAGHYKEHPGDNHFNGWDCTDRQTGYEVSEINCTRRRDGRHQHVRFEFGS
jgi:hypothetical protein